MKYVQDHTTFIQQTIEGLISL